MQDGEFSKNFFPDSSKRKIMSRQFISLGSAAAIMLLTVSSAAAGGDTASVPESVKMLKEKKPKRTLNGNMTLNYNLLPGKVERIQDLFAKGIFYGRLRMNSFYWHWADPVYPNNAPREMGLGGSLIYKSAVLSGFSFTASYYGSMNPDFFRPQADEVGFAKAGKDTFSRYKVATGGGFGLSTFGQTYLEYDNDTVDIRGGRQFFESVFTKSNDTKMIPNTFDGLSGALKIAPKTRVRVAWFDKQKLRDHEDGHDVITFKSAPTGDERLDKYRKWNNNDDAGKHKGLSYDNFIKAGEDPDHDLYLADIETRYLKNLKLTGSYLQVPGVLRDFVVEAHYKIPFSDTGWAVRPGIREFIQRDDGGGAVAGDSNALGRPLAGYDPDVEGSLDSSLFNARVDLLMPGKRGFFRLGYSKVADEADIIAPWRGFPTGGFTRAMAQYNWFSNTETIMLRAVYKFNSVWKASIRYAIEDYDDAKPVPSDANVIHIDTWTNITPELQMRMRYGHVLASADTPSATDPEQFKPDWSYDEFRLEFNYLF